MKGKKERADFAVGAVFLCCVFPSSLNFEISGLSCSILVSFDFPDKQFCSVLDYSINCFLMCAINTRYSSDIGDFECYYIACVKIMRGGTSGRQY